MKERVSTHKRLLVYTSICLVSMGFPRVSQQIIYTYYTLIYFSLLTFHHDTLLHRSESHDET